MAVPKSRHTKSRKNRRRANIYLKTPSIGVCSKCGKPVLLHTVCPNCGYYKKRMIVNVLEKLEKKKKKQIEGEMKDIEKTETKQGQHLSLKEQRKK